MKKSLDIDAVMEMAKEVMLAASSHAPMLLISTPARVYPLPVRDWPETADLRAKALFFIGRAFGQEQGVRAEEVTALFLVNEVWTVKVAPGSPIPVSAEEHPDRRECLSVLELRPTAEKALEQKTYMADILRHGKTIGLGPPKTIEVQSRLLTSFFAGLGSAQWSDLQLLERMKGDL